MKGLLAVVILLLLSISAINWWQMQELRQEVARLQAKLNEQQNGGVTDQVVAQATRAIAQARDAIAATDAGRARVALESARDYLAQAGRTASERAAPTVKWLQNEAAELSRQVQDKVKNARK